MTRFGIGHRTRWIGTLLVLWGTVSVRAQELVAGDMSPRISNSSGQLAHYGFYPTQWKTFPGTWSEVRPLVVTPAPIAELTRTAEPPMVKREAEAGASKMRFILPDDSVPPVAIDRTVPALPAPTQAFDRPKTAQARMSGVPNALLPESSTSKSVAYVGSSLDARTTKSSDPVWLKAGATSTAEEPKAWLGLPTPINNSTRFQATASDANNPWRSVSPPKN